MQRVIRLCFGLVGCDFIEAEEIGFQPVALKMTGWKPIPRQKSDIY